LAVEPHVRIEKMNDQDIDEVLAIEQLSFPVPWNRQLFKQEIRNPYSRSYVLRISSGTVTGYLIFWLVMDEAHILNIAVHPGYRSLGFGNMLMGFAMDQIETGGGKTITLEVRRSNSVAISMYRKFGFTSVGIRKNYYVSSNEDALIMEKKLF